MPLCAHCNAPLPHGQINCRYCGAANDIDLSGRHYYTVHRPEEPRICPVCSIPMETVDLGGVGVQGTFYIERCSKCMGLFFDPGELDCLLSETSQKVFSIDHRQLATLQNSKPSEPESISYRPCPVCRKLMNRQNFAERSGVVIDCCHQHGIFLDGGELRRIQLWIQSGGALLAKSQKEKQAPVRLDESEMDLSNESTQYSWVQDLLSLVAKVIRYIAK